MDQASRHLGILKVDVDNLGHLFREGLPANYRSLTRFLAMSRILKWFFAGYLETLCRQTPFLGKLYIIFSGGDDIFLTGPWHLLLDFAGKIRKEFAHLIGNTERVTLSGGFLVLDPHYPVNQFARLAEGALSSSKDRGKNKITVFGETITWNDLEKAREFQESLTDLIRSAKVSRKVLRTLRQSANGFDRRTRRANQPILRMPRIWRLQYMLRDSALGKDKAQKRKHLDEIETRIIQPYQDLITQAFTQPGSSDHHPILFAVAARWTEYLLRNHQTTPKHASKH